MFSKSDKQKKKKKKKSPLLIFIPFPLRFSIFHLFPFKFSFFFSPFSLLCPFFPVGQQKFPSEKCLVSGGTLPPAPRPPTCYATGPKYIFFPPVCTTQIITNVLKLEKKNDHFSIKIAKKKEQILACSVCIFLHFCPSKTFLGPYFPPKFWGWCRHCTACRHNVTKAVHWGFQWMAESNKQDPRFKAFWFRSSDTVVNHNANRISEILAL